MQVAVTLKHVATLAAKSAFVVSSGNHDGNERAELKAVFAGAVEF